MSPGGPEHAARMRIAAKAVQSPSGNELQKPASADVTQPVSIHRSPPPNHTTAAAARRATAELLQAQMGNRAGGAIIQGALAGGSTASVAVGERALDDGSPGQATEVAIEDRLGNSALLQGLRMAPSDDRAEAQATRFAVTGIWSTPLAPGESSPISVSGVQSVQRAVNGPGSPVDQQLRRRFEAELGLGLGPVRIHTDGDASSSARALGAKAYTVGSDIVFSSGNYQPGSVAGRELLAHELAHVAQQAAEGVPVLAAFSEVGSGDLGDLVSHVGEPAGCEIEASEKTKAAAGGGLIVHDLTHVAQQSSGRGAHSTERSHRPSMLQRTPDQGSGPGQSTGNDPETEYDPEADWESELSLLDRQISDSDSDPQARAPIVRQRLLLEASQPDAPNRVAYDAFSEHCYVTAQDESKTIAALGDPDLTHPEAFPKTWSDRLKPHLIIANPPDLLEREVAVSQAEMEKSGRDISNWIFDHGLPVDLRSSLGLQVFRLSSGFAAAMGAFAWTTEPAGTVSIGSGPLVAFLFHAMKYLHALNDADFFNLWIKLAESVVQEVENAEISVDPEAFDRYEKENPGGVAWGHSLLAQVTGMPQPLSGRIDPAVAVKWVTSWAAWSAFGRSFLHAIDIATLADRFIGLADSQIADEDPAQRQLRAGRWGHEHGFYLAAVERELEEIKEHAVDIGVGMAKDVGIFTIIQFIPVVNVIADIYMGAQLVLDVADTIDDISSANEEAREAKTAVALQRAAAQQATAVSSAARKVATAMVMHTASKLAKKGARKLHGWATMGEGAGAGPEAPAVPEDPAKVPRGPEIPPPPPPPPPPQSLPSVWVQLADGRVREYEPLEVQGQRQPGKAVSTPDGYGRVASVGELPSSGQVRHEPIKPLISADELNRPVQQRRGLFRQTQRPLEPIERDNAKMILAVLTRFQLGDEAALNELAGFRIQELKGDLAGWREVDLKPGNPGAVNQMRIIFRVRGNGSIEARLLQMH